MTRFGLVISALVMLIAVFSGARWTFTVQASALQLPASPATALVPEFAFATTPDLTPVPMSTLAPTPSLTTGASTTATATIAIATPAARYEIVCSSDHEQARQAYNDGIASELQGKREQAKAAYLSAIQLDANYCDAMDNLARLLRQEGRLEDAVSLYKRSISISPNNIVAHTNLAVVYQLQERTEDAMAEYQRVVEIAPDDPEGYFGLGSVFLDKKQPDQAIIHLKKAEDLYVAKSSPLISDARYYLGIAHFMSRQFAKAIDYFELVYAGMEDNPYLNYYLGLCYLSPEIGGRELANKYLKRAEELGIAIPAQVRSLANEPAAPTATQTPTAPATAMATVALPLPTGQPVSSWNDIPIMPQAISGSEDRGAYSYTVKATIQQVQDFYDEEMTQAGWRPFVTSSGRSDTKMVMYQKGSKTSSALIVEQGEVVLVVLILN